MIAAPTISILETKSVRLADLRPYPANPRNGDIDLIRESVRAHGQFRAMVVNRRDMTVLAGNHLLHALLAEDFTEGLCHFVDVDDEEAARIVLVDNRANDVAKYDDGLLAELLQSLPDLSGTGYGQEDLDQLLGVQPKQGLTDPDDVPELPKEAVTKPGDLWLLGGHRLLCGDATKAEDYERLMDGRKADMVWTDPPYGVSYVGKTQDKLRLKGDKADGLMELLVSAFRAADGNLKPGSPFYIARPPGALSVTFGEAIAATGWHLHEELQWVKDSMVLGHSDYHLKHETIVYGFKPGEGRHGRGAKNWYGSDSEVSVFAVARPKASPDHPTCKPVDLIAAHLLNSSRHGEIVLDPFAGSGTTLIAAEQEGRVAYCMEIDPLYCDVICRRFHEFTGTLPILESTGEEHDFCA